MKTEAVGTIIICLIIAALLFAFPTLAQWVGGLMFAGAACAVVWEAIREKKKNMEAPPTS